MRASWWLIATLIMLWIFVMSIPGLGIQEHWIVTAFLASAVVIVLLLWMISLI